MLIARRIYREKNSALSCLIGSHRIAPTHAARRFQQLVPFNFIFFANKRKSPTHVGYEIQEQLAINNSIRG